MVSSTALNKVLISGVLLITGCCLVLSYPSITEDDDDGMMADEYDYGPDDQNVASQPVSQPKPTNIAKSAVPKANRTVTKTGILGEDVLLKCDEKITKDDVILWYQNSKLIANGQSLLLPNFSLDPKSYDLTILKASAQSAGDYYCQILPQNVFMHTKVILGDHSLDVITPESSKSAQDSLHRFALMWLLTLALLVLHQHKH
ncbi:uncharacterized protein LOC115760645 [Drosophila novamexicana]|uniref:uncharacterized protein LOC115760645 n=1 Tax=Drosophila novamexicana TaxID=47314 RepID=UPI0011E5E06D|nr:uncharacterized protein LOC115760645 [Drosophila novamexicana]